jgi:hypothetical protein
MLSFTERYCRGWADSRTPMRKNEGALQVDIAGDIVVEVTLKPDVWTGDSLERIFACVDTAREGKLVLSAGLILETLRFMD